MVTLSQQSGLGYVTINYHVSYGSVVYFSQVVVGNTQGLMALVDLRGKGKLDFMIKYLFSAKYWVINNEM